MLYRKLRSRKHLGNERDAFGFGAQGDRRRRPQMKLVQRLMIVFCLVALGIPGMTLAAQTTVGNVGTRAVTDVELEGNAIDDLSLPGDDWDVINGFPPPHGGSASIWSGLIPDPEGNNIFTGGGSKDILRRQRLALDHRNRPGQGRDHQCVRGPVRREQALLPRRSLREQRRCSAGILAAPESSQHEPGRDLQRGSRESVTSSSSPTS